MKDKIRLTYVEGKKTYHGEIDRKDFLNQMEHMVNWFPGCNDNASSLCKLIPDIDYITINQDIINTQDVPFIEYQMLGENTPRIFKFLRAYTIIWSFFLHHCDEAKKNQ